MLTPAYVDSLAAVYPSTSAASYLAALGLKVGQLYQVPNTSKVGMFVQAYASASESLKVGAMCYLQNHNPNAPVVDETQAATSPLFGINDNAPAAVPAGSYFFLTVNGPCQVLSSDGDAADTYEVPSATAGTGANASAYSVHQANKCLLLVANSSGAAALRAAWLFGGI